MPKARTSYSDSPEALVVGLAQTGDRDAFAVLVQRRQSWIRNLMRLMCGDETLAGDLAQQTFLQAWRDITRLRQPRKFGPWLKQIAINTFRQHFRKKDALRNAQDQEEIDNSVIDTPAAALDLERSLATLSDSIRLCVVLSYYEGMTHTEIASLTKQPIGTVKSNIRRGAERLKVLLSAYDESIPVEDIS